MSKVAAQIVELGGDYVLGLKGNQGLLHKDVELFFNTALEKDFENILHSYHEEIDAGHGRIETRRVWTVDDLSWLEGKEQWEGLNTIAMVEATRDTFDKNCCEKRFYISSIDDNNAKILGDAVRAHWGIENTLHWSPDVTFQEDRCRVRKGYAAENLAVVRHIALGLLQQENSVNRGIKTKRLKAALNPSYLYNILTLQ